MEFFCQVIDMRQYIHIAMSNIEEVIKSNNWSIQQSWLKIKFLRYLVYNVTYVTSNIYDDTRKQNLLLFTNIGQFFALFINYLESTMSEYRFVSESVFIVMKLNLLCALTLSRMSQSFDIAGGRYVRITCHINDLDYASWCEPTAWQAMVDILSLLIHSSRLKSNIFFIKCAYCYFFSFFFFDFRCLLRKKMRYFHS